MQEVRRLDAGRPHHQFGRHEIAAGEVDPEHHFCVTDAGDRFARIGAIFLGAERLSLEWVDV